MSYVLTDGDGNIVKYPYSLGNLRTDNPNVSISMNPKPEALEYFNVYPVEVPPEPPINEATQKRILSNTPELNGQQWRLPWIIAPLTPTELQNRAKKAAENKFNAAVTNITGSRGIEERLGLVAAVCEAYVWSVDPDALTPIMDGMATVFTQDTKQQLANRILNRDPNYLTGLGAALARKIQDGA